MFYIVSDIAVFVLKRDVKLQLTNFHVLLIFLFGSKLGFSRKEIFYGPF